MTSYTALLQAKVGVWENKDCARNYIGRQKVLETMLCASGKKKDACAGDSGGIWVLIHHARCHIPIVKIYDALWIGLSQRSTKLLQLCLPQLGALWNHLLGSRSWLCSARSNCICFCICILIIFVISWLCSARSAAIANCKMHWFLFLYLYFYSYLWLYPGGQSAQIQVSLENWKFNPRASGSLHTGVQISPMDPKHRW